MGYTPLFLSKKLAYIKSLKKEENILENIIYYLKYGIKRRRERRKK
jgi:hypothetical protein